MGILDADAMASCVVVRKDSKNGHSVRQMVPKCRAAGPLARPPLGDPLLRTTSTQSALIGNGIGLERAVTGTRGIDAPESAHGDDLERYSQQRFGPFIAHHVHVPAAGVDEAGSCRIPDRRAVWAVPGAYSPSFRLISSFATSTYQRPVRKLCSIAYR